MTTEQLLATLLVDGWDVFLHYRLQTHEGDDIPHGPMVFHCMADLEGEFHSSDGQSLDAAVRDVYGQVFGRVTA